jgi:hypothetical protein
MLAFEAELAHLPRSLISAVWEVLSPAELQGLVSPNPAEPVEESVGSSPA